MAEKYWTLSRTLLYVVAIIPIVAFMLAFFAPAVLPEHLTQNPYLVTGYAFLVIWMLGSAMTFGLHYQYRQDIK